MPKYFVERTNAGWILRIPVAKVVLYNWYFVRTIKLIKIYFNYLASTYVRNQLGYAKLNIKTRQIAPRFKRYQM